MVEDISLLALVLDDPVAPLVLAWWKARRPGRSLTLVSSPTASALEMLDQAAMTELCRVARTDEFMVAATVERCDVAGLFASDGGISDVADKWLRTHVGLRLGAGPSSGRTSPGQGPKPAPPKARPRPKDASA